MMESDLARIESELAVPLPRFYRDYALGLADEDARIVAELFERFDEPWSALYTKADEVVEANRYLRRGMLTNELWVVGDDRRPFSTEGILLVGENGGGNYCFIRTDGSDEGLWWWDHETLQVEQFYTTLAGLHKWLLDLLAECEANQ